MKITPTGLVAFPGNAGPARVGFAIGLAFLAMGLVTPARALVIAGGTGTEHRTDPGGGLPWGNVASNGVYLGAFDGEYWAITATHVGAGNMVLGGITYNLVPGSSVRVLNGNGSNTDLTLFRISSDPGLGRLNLATAAPVANDVVVFEGDGGVEANGGTQLFWSVTGSGAGTTWTSLPNNSGANASGFGVGGSTGMRWGNAVVATDNSSYNVGTGLTDAFVTQFVGVTGASQGAVGDSGGAAFFYSGGTWYLSGILGAIGNYTNQPASTAVFGDVTYVADIASYQNFIVAEIPEPTDVGLLVGSLSAAGAIIVRTRRRPSL